MNIIDRVFFGDRMRAMRSIRCFNIAQMELHTGIKAATLGSIERGDVTPSPLLERRIREVLSWPPESDEIIDQLYRATYQGEEAS